MPKLTNVQTERPTMALTVSGVVWGYVFTWAYVVVICSRPEFLQVVRVKAVCDGEVKGGGCNESVFAINHGIDGRWGFILIRGCADAVGEFIRGGIICHDVILYGALRGDKGGMEGVLNELVQLQAILYCCLSRGARPSLYIGSDI